MTPLLLALVVMAAEGYFLPQLQPAAQPPALRGQAQGNEFYPEYNKIEENLNYNNRFLYQSPNYQHFANNQRYYSQAAAHAYGPPHLQNLYQQPEQLAEPVYSDIRDSPIYIQPHDEETTRQQTLTITPQYLNLPSQSPDALSQYSTQQLQVNQYPTQQLQANQYQTQQLLGNPQVQGNFRGQGIQGLQTTAQTTIPVLVKVSDNQALIVPVRAVYALPGFLERLVQRVQGHYSVYNPIENLVVDRPYYVSTAGGVEDAPIQPVEVASNADVAPEPIKADLVLEPSQGSSESAEMSAPEVNSKFGDLKQEEVKEETTTAAGTEEDEETTTEMSTEEPKVTTEKEDDSATDASESSDAMTVPPTSSAEVSPSSTEVSSTEVSSTSPASTTEEPSSTSTTKPEEKPQEAASAEDNSATSDLESAGYTYYRPAIPFYFPPK